MGALSTRPLHPRHGVHDQSARTPARRPNSVRRTTTVDSVRFDGPTGPTTVIGTGRDLRTSTDGDGAVLSTAGFELILEPLDTVVQSARVTDGEGELDGLVGASVASGFRRLLPGLAIHPAGLLHRLLDDLPGAVLVGNYPVLEAGAFPVQPRELLVLTDVCRGWANGGSQHADIAAGRIPTPTGPVPVDLSAPEDPPAWHRPELPDLDVMRRARRIDVAPTGDGIEIDAHFRDVWVPREGAGMVVHEYSVTARADAGSRELTAIAVRAHALPWRECNAVPESAQLVVGARLGELDAAVRTRLSGTVGCTHLNDTLRGLDAVPFLVDTHL